MGQTCYILNEKQNFLFPLDEMYITQGSYTATLSYKYISVLCIFDYHLVAKWDSSSNYQAVLQSDDEENFLYCNVGYACIDFIYDPYANVIIGTSKRQGEKIGITGNYDTTNNPIIYI